MQLSPSPRQKCDKAEWPPCARGNKTAATFCWAEVKATEPEDRTIETEKGTVLERPHLQPGKVQLNVHQPLCCCEWQPSLFLTCGKHTSSLAFLHWEWSLWVHTGCGQAVGTNGWAFSFLVLQNIHTCAETLSVVVPFLHTHKNTNSHYQYLYNLIPPF